MQRRAWIILIIFMSSLFVFGIILRTAPYRTHFTMAEQLLHEAVAPFQRLTNSVISFTTNGVERLAALREAVEQNEKLTAEVAELRAERDSLMELRQENDALRAIFDLVAPVTEEVAVAQVIARSPTNWLGSVTINKGRRHGIAANMPVVTTEGVVGKVRHVTEHTSEVILLTDARSSVGGRLVQDGYPVLVEGRSDRNEQQATVRLLAWEASLHEGDVVVTSELSRTFPEGLPIGRIVTVQPHSPGAAPEALLQPFVDFSRLRWVIVLQTRDMAIPWWGEGQ